MASGSEEVGKDYDDLKWLVYLETLKRTKNNEAMMKQKLKLGYKNLEDNVQHYNMLLSKFATLLKLSILREKLKADAKRVLLLEETEKAVENIKHKLNPDTANALINNTELEKFKKVLGSLEEHENLKQLRSQLEDLKNISETIRTIMASVTALLDGSVVDGLDYFTPYEED
uniref:Uncharacterized protein n=1 Tax=Glossina brevipalpis TaxID=37001 RepID=A0A1A9WUK1_9MUSC